MSVSKPVPAREFSLGSRMLERGQAQFLVWAPYARTVGVHVFGTQDSTFRLEPAGDGYFCATVDGLACGTKYKYRLNDEIEYPDPASRFQPDGVHGPSTIVNDAFHWTDTEWTGIPLTQYIFYEMHVGAFTREGTFDSAITKLDYLADLGATAIELMPVTQFPGTRNWGYDGVYPFAVQHSYGGPDGLKRFVDAAHAKGLAVVLDVVYNHLGPEGNYVGNFGPYFTDRYQTPWGLAVNYDGPDSDGVRRFVVENALRWVTEFHIDALRLDAVHAIFDASPRHILQELAEAVHEYGRQSGRHIHVIGESDLNDCRLVEPVREGGYGLDAQWSDDFHHSLHTLLTGEREGYYQDFGRIHDLAKAVFEGFVYSGQVSAYRQRPHGACSRHIPAERFVVCTQNHDQVGNRMMGERLTALLQFEQLKLAAGVLLMSPFLPLLFMGQEYGETAPFLYFVSHSDPALIEAVRQGRRREFAAFSWRGEVADADGVATFERSQLDHSLKQSSYHKALLGFYKELIRLRKSLPSPDIPSREAAVVPVSDDESVLVIQRGAGSILAICHFGPSRTAARVVARPGSWHKVLDSSDRQWMGPGSPSPQEVRSEGTLDLALNSHSICVFQWNGAA